MRLDGEGGVKRTCDLASKDPGIGDRDGNSSSHLLRFPIYASDFHSLFSFSRQRQPINLENFTINFLASVHPSLEYIFFLANIYKYLQ